MKTCPKCKGDGTYQNKSGKLFAIISTCRTCNGSGKIEKVNDKKEKSDMKK